MGVLEHEGSGRQIDLLPRTLVGRGPACDLVLDEPGVSREHAVLSWEGSAWQLRDLGSSNGTRLDGRPIAPGQAVALSRGARLVFGLGDDGWRLAVAAPPQPMAIELDSGTIVLAEGDLLGLPDPDAPLVLLVRSASGAWVLEDEHHARQVSDRERLVVDGRTWELRLPVGFASTAQGAILLEGAQLEFEVSLDEEHVSWAVIAGGRREALGARVHTYLLLTLARARLQDTQLPEASQGWRYADELARRLDITPEVLKVYVYRARKQLQAAGVVGAAELIQRRPSSNQIRLGVSQITIHRG